MTDKSWPDVAKLEIEIKDLETSALSKGLYIDDGIEYVLVSPEHWRDVLVKRIEDKIWADEQKAAIERRKARK